MALPFRARLTMSVGCLTICVALGMASLMLLLGVSLVGLAVYVRTEAYHSSLMAVAEHVTLAPEPPGGSRDWIYAGLAEQFTAIPNTRRVAFFDLEGAPMLGAAQNAPDLAPQAHSLVADALREQGDDNALGVIGRDLAVASLVRRPDGTPAGVAFVQYNLTDAFDLLGAGFYAGLWLLAAIMLGCIVLTLLLSRRVSRPLRELAAVVQAFGEGDFSRRARVHSYREVRSLARAFNTMAEGIQTATQQLAQETQRVERLESELRIGAEVQRALLPERSPALPGIWGAGWSRAARQVGGDFFDYIPLGGGRLGVAVGDATDKGLPAALLITECSSILRALARQEPDPGALLTATNAALAANLGESCRFVTLFYAVVDVPAQRLVYANAGHPPGLLLRGDGSDVSLLSEVGGLPLGVLANEHYQDCALPLRPGDRLLVYSDGITEAAAADGTLFGIDGLRAAAQARRSDGLSAFMDALRAHVQDYRQGHGAGDDMTLVAVQLEETPPALQT